MNCPKCNHKNRIDSNYCLKCGYKFTKKEKETYKNKTLQGKIEKIISWYNTLTLKVITDNPIFKALSALAILGVGIYFLLTMGYNTKIVKSNMYKLTNNKDKSEYYLIVKDKDEVPLDIYIPNRCKNITIKHLDKDGKELDSKKYTKKDEIILKTNLEDYYILTSNYKNNKESFKIYLYKEDNIILDNK